MTHPAIVNAAENHFVPLLVVNNKSGNDATMLKKFGEPAWNYQVIRFYDSDVEELIPRKDKVWTTLPLLKRMQFALEKDEKEVPRYLKLAISELETSNHKTVAISQHCFWTGEALLGRIHGVVQTEAGWFDGKEVTKITYDKSKVDITNLLKGAKKLKCADGVYITDAKDLETAKKLAIMPAKALSDEYRKAKGSDQKRQVNQLSLPKSLTAAQLTKFNSYYHQDKAFVMSFLTETQQAELKE